MNVERFDDDERSTPARWCGRLLLGFGTGRERTLAGLRRTYERATGKSLVPSSFYDRFSQELTRMFRAVLRELMRKLAASEVRYGGVLEGFRDVLVADATVVKVLDPASEVPDFTTFAMASVCAPSKRRSQPVGTA